MDVFVTGGSGFLGQHLLRALLRAGHGPRALARSDTTAQVVADTGARVVRGDLGDAAALRAGMAGCDVIVHAAATTSPWGSRAHFQTVNVEGTTTVLSAARLAGVGRLVFVSSEAVLADGAPLVQVDETRPRSARPVGNYARSKADSERIVLSANAQDFTTLAVRPRLLWGPGDTTILPQILNAARAGRFAWINHGRYLTSTCHVVNACEGILAAVKRGRGGEAYFLSDGNPVELRAFLTALAATAGVRLPNRSLPRRLMWLVAAVGETMWRVLPLPGIPPVTRTFLALSAQEMTVDDSKARQELGYRPLISIEEGLADLTR